MTVDVHTLRVSDLRAATTLHGAAFPSAALTRLGSGAVRRYYEWLLVGPHTTTALGAWTDEKLVGFLFAGTFQGAMTGFLHRNRHYLALHIATHPWLVFTPLVRDRAVMALRLLDRHRRVNAAPPVPPPRSPTFGILAVGVDPRVQGRGVGKVLMEGAERAARERGFERIQLTVAPSNEQAVRFYLRNGWEKVDDGGRWKGSMTKRL